MATVPCGAASYGSAVCAGSSGVAHAAAARRGAQWKSTLLPNRLNPFLGWVPMSITCLPCCSMLGHGDVGDDPSSAGGMQATCMARAHFSLWPSRSPTIVLRVPWRVGIGGEGFAMRWAAAEFASSWNNEECRKLPATAEPWLCGLATWDCCWWAALDTAFVLATSAPYWLH